MPDKDSEVDDIAGEVMRAATPLEALAVLADKGEGAGLNAWLLAAEQGVWHGYLYSRWPLRGSSVQAHMAALADQYRRLTPEAACLPAASRLYPVQAGCREASPAFESWARFETFEVRVGDELVAMLRVGALSPVPRTDFEAAGEMVRQASAGLAYLVTRTAQESLGLLDPVTGLYSAAYFDDQLRREALRAASYGAELALMVVDVEPRKTTGPVDSAAMRTVAQVLAAHTRRTDVCARLGPARLGALMPHTSKRDALLAAGRLEDLVEAEAGVACAYKLRIGVSGWNLEGPDEGELLRQAEEAAHRAASHEQHGPFVY